MSNPPSVLPPNPYFNGIIYNPTDFLSVSPDSLLTFAQASVLFIQKTIADTVSGVTDFVNGITTSSILSKTISATCNLWTNATGEIFIGTLGGRSALIHIGDGNSNLAGSGVHINNGTNTASNVQILNGTGSTGTINLGSATSTTNVNCPLRITYAPSALTTNTMIGWTVKQDFTSAPFTLGSASVIASQSISTAGVYMVNWGFQYLNTTPVTYLFTNIAYGATAATLNPLVFTLGNWGNASLGNVGGNNFQSSGGSAVVTATAGSFINLILNTLGGTSTTAGTFLQVTRIG